MFDLLASQMESRRLAHRARMAHRRQRNFHHLLMYSYSDGTGGLQLQDSTASIDPSFSQRNGHIIFTENYNLIAAQGLGVTMTDAEFNVPSINAVGRHHIQPVMQLATGAVPSPHTIEDLRAYPMPLPTNEEIAVLISNGGVAPEHDSALLYIAPPTWSRNLPAGLQRLRVLATATITPGAYSWGPDATFAFETTLKGGWYSLVGAMGIGTALFAYRINFPRMPLIQGRKLYPGSIGLATNRDLGEYHDLSWLGHWGTFHTFEPPQVAGWSSATTNISATFYLDLIFHGDSPPAGSVSSMSL